jgi:S-adenosylmethionine synthetase
MKTYFSSESVTEGHPDKIADQISDSVLDAILAQDPNGRVACEVMVNTGLVVVSGEISTHCYIDIQAIARKKICEIGYDHGDMHFDGNSCAVLVAIDEQSPDIAQGVDEGQNHPQGAGDQGLMFGYATDETPQFMPLPITYAHQLTRQLAQTRKSGTIPYLRPDGKTQVTFEYENQIPKRIHTIVLSTQHAPEISQKQIREDVLEKVIFPIGKDWIDEKTIFHINPTGKFVIGGPQGDCGLTGRKIIVDTYGGAARHGGGCFSGKDPSKVDRSGAYMARFIAKNLVANGLAKRCEIQLAYAIGVAEPVSVFVETFGTSKKSEEELEQIVRKNFELTPKGLIKSLDLLRPIYAPTATYGHFGRTDLDLPWEKIITMV